MSTTPAHHFTRDDVLTFLRDAMHRVIEDADMVAEDYTGDAVPGDDASQAAAWAEWCACQREKALARAIIEQVAAERTAPTARGIDPTAAAADAFELADGYICAAIADAREYSPDSWTAHKADPNA